MPSSCVVIKTPFVRAGCTADPRHVEYIYRRQGECVKHKEMSQRYACREECEVRELMRDPSSFNGRRCDPCAKCDVERRKRRPFYPPLPMNLNEPLTVTPSKKDSISCCTVM